MVRWMMLAAAAAAVATPAFAQEAQQGEGEPPKRVRNVILFGQDACPKPSSPDEIVVCSSGGDSPYRIPPKLREPKKRPANESWAVRSQVIEDSARDSRPGSCSVVGSGGQTGCNRQFLEAWAAERRQQQNSVPTQSGEEDPK